MLDAFIIDRLKRQKERDRNAQIPLHVPPPPEPPEPTKPTQEEIDFEVRF